MAIIKRVSNFFDYFSVNQVDTEQVSIEANGMTHRKDYDALAAICLYTKPKFIFEIGTFLGVTSNFFLELLPNCRVVSIAYIGDSNNSELPEYFIGSAVKDKSRFTQIIGNSQEIDSKEFLSIYGSPDLIFIDGDHSYSGVCKDTTLAFQLGAKTICWHDANPKQKYIDVRKFLEEDPRFNAVATEDNYIGGIAVALNL